MSDERGEQLAMNYKIPEEIARTMAQHATSLNRNKEIRAWKDKGRQEVARGTSRCAEVKDAAIETEKTIYEVIR